jgi:uncharacterized protein (DUF2236 family)
VSERTDLDPLPSPEQLADLVPAPGSAVWRIAGDARLLAGAGAALVLQVAHPTVAAGVRDHSSFAADPWGRLLRTLDFTNALVFGGPDLAGATGRRVWRLHAAIAGITPDGRPYRAREPEAYAWVHASLADSIVDSHERFVGALGRAELERFWAGWRALGRVVGVAGDELPGTWEGFAGYRERMIAERLADSDVVREVLDALRAPAAPPLPAAASPAWRIARLPIGKLFALATVGLLPPPLRERLGLEWGRAEALELSLLAAASRAATPLLPGSLREFGTTYRRLRGARGSGVAGAPVAAPT